MEKEIWKSIEGYPEYSISNLGNVLSKKWGKEKILRQSRSRGYCKIQISNNEGPKPFSVHRLVAMAFVSNPYNKPHVNHIDGNRENNNATNLEWCTAAENNQHAIRTGANLGIAYYYTRTKKIKIKKERVYKSGSSHPKSKRVFQYTLDNEFVYSWGSTCEVERVVGFNYNKIGEACRGERKTYKGYIWKYKNEKSLTKAITK